MRPDVLAASVARAMHALLAPVLVRVAAGEDTRTRQEATLSELRAAHADLRERMATLEARPLVPGPPGPAGQDGRDGLPGKDGAPGLRYAGVYVDGKTYDHGDVVTWAGSTWHCNDTTTTKPGETAQAWTLMVKRGRDGKDAKGA